MLRTLLGAILFIALGLGFWVLATPISYQLYLFMFIANAAIELYIRHKATKEIKTAGEHYAIQNSIELRVDPNSSLGTHCYDGLKQSTIVFDSAFFRLPINIKKAIILHELTHIKYRHGLIRSTCRAICLFSIIDPIIEIIARLVKKCLLPKEVSTEYFFAFRYYISWAVFIYPLFIWMVQENWLIKIICLALTTYRIALYIHGYQQETVADIDWCKNSSLLKEYDLTSDDLISYGAYIAKSDIPTQKPIKYMTEIFGWFPLSYHPHSRKRQLKITSIALSKPPIKPSNS